MPTVNCMSIFQNHIKLLLKESLVEVVSFDGDNFIVAPCVALVPGVRNNSYISLEVIRQSVEDWEDKPIIIYHSEDEEGNPVLYDSPQNVNESQIGYIKNPRIEGGKLKVDCWISENSCNEVGALASYIVNQAKEEATLEVSIGFLALTYEKAGLFGGKRYNEIIERVSPDHLAILPFAEGACSVADGCGFPRAYQEVNFMALKKLKPIIHIQEDQLDDVDSATEGMAESFINYITGKFDKLNKQSQKEETTSFMTTRDKEINLFSLVREELSDREFWDWRIYAVDDDSVTIEDKGEFKKKNYSVNESGVLQLDGDWQKVQVSTEFIPYQKSCSCGGNVILKTEEKEKEVMAENVGIVTNTPQVDTLQVFLDEHKISKSDILTAIAFQKSAHKEVVEKAKEAAKALGVEIDESWPIDSLKTFIAASEKNLAKQEEAKEENPGVYPRMTGTDDNKTRQFAERPKMLHRRKNSSRYDRD